MSKKRKVIFGIAVAAAWITVLALAAVFLLPKLLDQPQEQVKGSNAEETVRLALDGIISGGTEQPVLLGITGEPVPVSPATGVAGLISAKLEYEILSVQTQETSGLAQLRITAPDAVVLIQTAIAAMEQFDEAQLLTQVEQLLKQEYATVEYSVEVELAKVEKTWCVVTNEAFSDAITGGLISRYTQVQQTIMDALAGGEG